MSNNLQEAVFFVKQQHEWLVDLQSVLAEKEQKYKILYNKLNYQLKKEMKNESLELSENVRYESYKAEDELSQIQNNLNEIENDDELSDITDCFDDVNETKNQKYFVVRNKTLSEEEIEEGKEQEIHGRKYPKLMKNANRDEKPYKCLTCDRSFQKQYNLLEHKNTHSGEKPLECPYCHEKFGQKIKFTRHVRTHTDDENPYKCKFCYKKFSHPSRLNEHTRTHTGEKPFTCSFCDRSFQLRSSLVLHERTHTGEKPFECTLCYKSFARSTTLTRHIRTHTGEKPYKCKFCRQHFAGRSNLMVHTRKKH